MNPTVPVLALGLAGLVVACVIYWLLMRRPPVGAGRSAAFLDGIPDGVMAHLGRTYAGLAVSSAAMALLLIAGFQGWRISLAFVVAILCSASAGYIGLYAAARANPRGARTDRTGSIRVAFQAGAVNGLAVTSLGLLGVGSLYLLFGDDSAHATALHGFVLGTFTTAWFLHVGGVRFAGVAAPAGADIMHMAGMGVGLLGFWSAALIPTVTIASTLPAPVTALIGPQHRLMFLPLALAATGLVSFMAGIGVVALVSARRARTAIVLGSFGTSLLFIAAAFPLVVALDASPLVWFCVASGALGGHVAVLVTGHYAGGAPVSRTARAAETGPATVLIRGLAAGMGSVIIPVLTITAIIGAAGYLMPEGAGFFGVGMAAIGMLSTMGFAMALPAFVSWSDGIPAMAGLDTKPREDGEPTEATGIRGAGAGGNFAMVAAGLAALTMFGACLRILSQRLPAYPLQVSEPVVLIGLLLGGILPFLLAAVILRVPGAAGLVTGATGPALWRLLLPGLLGVLAPVVTAFGLGARALGGLLGGVLVSGLLLALFIINTGGVWGGARRYLGRAASAGDDTDRREAAAAAHPVGRSLRDDCASSLAILINVVAIVSLMIAQLLSR